MFSAELANLPVPELPYAKSMVSHFEENEEDEDQRAVFSEYYFGEHGLPYEADVNRQNNGVMVKKGPYKLIDYCNGETELYDIKDDPKELNNLIKDPSYDAVIMDLKRELLSLPKPWRIASPEWTAKQPT